MSHEDAMRRRADELNSSLWVLGDCHPLHLAEKEAVIYAQERPQRREQVQEDAPPKVQVYPPTPLIDQLLAVLHGESLSPEARHLHRLVEGEAYGH